MTKMGASLNKVLSANRDGCLKYFTLKAQWGMVLCNMKYILKCVLKAINYIRSQGVVLKNLKGTYMYKNRLICVYKFIFYIASNILLNMDCPCIENDVLPCCCCCQGFAVKLSLSSSMVAGMILYIPMEQSPDCLVIFCLKFLWANDHKDMKYGIISILHMLS